MKSNLTYTADQYLDALHGRGGDADDFWDCSPAEMAIELVEEIIRLQKLVDSHGLD